MTSNLSVTATSPIAIMTYGIEPIYLIGDGPRLPPESNQGMSSRGIALAATFSVLGALSFITFLLVLIRCRYRRRRASEQPSPDLELPKYSRHSPDPLTGLNVRYLRAYERERAAGRHIGITSHVDGAGDSGDSQRTGKDVDAPPAYDSAQVWDADDPSTRVPTIMQSALNRRS